LLGHAEKDAAGAGGVVERDPFAHAALLLDEVVLVDHCATHFLEEVLLALLQFSQHQELVDLVALASEHLLDLEALLLVHDLARARELEGILLVAVRHVSEFAGFQILHERARGVIGHEMERHHRLAGGHNADNVVGELHTQHLDAVQKPLLLRTVRADGLVKIGECASDGLVVVVATIEVVLVQQ